MNEIDKIPLAQALILLKHWQEFPGKESIYRELIFKDFSEAFAFMTSIAIKAEVMGHHPDWFNSYNSVTVCLMTKDINGISHLDIELAEHIDAYMNKYMETNKFN